MASNVIKNLKDVYNVASKLFPCGAKKLEDINSDGKMGIKLIVGFKLNPSYDPNADPKKPGLTLEERKLEEFKANPKVPDIRILWLRPGITEEELVNEHLLGIKKSLDRKVPIIEKNATGIGEKVVYQRSDDEIANEIFSGKKSVVEVDPDDEIDEIGFGEKVVESSYGSEPQLTTKKNEPEPQSEYLQILEAIRTLDSNMESLSNDVNLMNDSVNGIEDRLNVLEGREPKKRGRKAK